MIYFLIALKFCAEIYVQGEYGIHGQIIAMKGKYNQIRANKAKCG